MDTLHVGDIVFLKSGSPAMTAFGNVDEGILCHWMVSGELFSEVFCKEQLTKCNTEHNMHKKPVPYIDMDAGNY